VSRSELAAPPSPFKGLAPFEDSALDALLFFGREREIEVIVANLMANRLTVLYGPSGVGKTSLLRAGVAQRLREEPDAIVVIVSSWVGDPFTEILDATEQAALALPDSTVEPVRRIGSLADVLGTWTRRLDRTVYLMLDQFEEYVLYHEGESGPGTLIEELPETLRRRGLRTNVLLGIREDSLAELDAFKGRIPNLFANTLGLDRLDRRAGEAAVVGPIEEYNRLSLEERRVEIEPELVDAVLREVTAGRVDLGQSGRGGVDDEADAGRIEAPYLQLVLERLWDVETGRGGRRLRLETLRDLGGAARIVQDHLDLAMSELSAGDKDAAAAMYNHLVTPSGAKIAHRVGDLAGYAVVDEADAARVLQRLVDQRIVRVGEDGAAGPRYEIFHDVLADAVLAWRTRHEADRRLEAEREVAEQRHRRTLAVAIAAGVAVAVLAAVSIYALTQRTNARGEARHARARELAALASVELPVDPERSLHLALQANAVEASRATEDVLRTTLRALRVEDVLRAGGPVAEAAFSPDGKLVVTAGGRGEARVFRADTGRLVRSLRHGAAPLVAASFSPDGSLIVTAGADGIARLWNARTGARLRELDHRGPISSATFSPNGKLLATTSADGTAKIWTIPSGRLLRRLDHGHAVKSASFSGDGTLLVTVLEPAANDRAARVFDVRSGHLVRRLVQPDRVLTARFAPTGDRAVTGGAGGFVRIWHARSRMPPVDLSGHKGQVLDAEFSPDGKRVVTASTDQTARVWDAETGVLVSPLAVHTNYVLAAHFSPDSQTVVTASADRRSVVFHAETGTILATLIGHKDAVTDAVFSPDGSTVASASTDGTARLWDPLPHPLLPLLGRHRGKVATVAFSPDGQLLASAGDDGDVRVWRFGSGLAQTLATGGPVTRLVFNRDGSLLLASSLDGAVRVWRTSDWSRFRTLRHRFPVVSADLSPDARFVATADEDGVIRLWDLAGTRTRWIRGGGRRVNVVAFSPDGRTLASAGADRVARLWRVSDGVRLHELIGHRGSIVAASFSRDGLRLVTASLDKTARIWNAETGAAEHVLRGHGGPLTSASFSPNSRLVVTTSWDHSSRVWNSASGKRLWQLPQAAIVNGASFSADSRWLVSAAPTAGVWEMNNGANLYLLRPRENLLTAVAFSPSGWRIATGGLDGSVRTYDCRLCGRAPRLAALAQKRLDRLTR
jgi:WD40 repeat protein